MVTLPFGTITFLLRDIEGSTRLWEQYPQAMKSSLTRHDHILRTAIEAQGGSVFKTVGDAFCAHQALQKGLKTGLGEAVYLAAWERGRGMSKEGAIKFGVGQEP